MKDAAGIVIVSVPIANEVYNDGIITVLELENMVLLGMTWGAWFKVGMLIALVLLIVERSLSVKNLSKQK